MTYKVPPVFIPIAKVESTKHVIKGVVYKPNEPDTQGDFMTAEEIEKMAYLFMKRAATNSIDTKHSYDYVHAYVCETYLAGPDDPDEYPEGSWVVCIKVEDDDVWSGIESGDYAGLSMAGVAQRVDD